MYLQYNYIMAKIIKIGNSQGIRIPKPLISLANLENQELEFVVLNNGLLITQEKKARVGWKIGNHTNTSTKWEWSKKS